MIPREKLSGLKKELEELHETIADPAVMTDPRKYRTLTRRFKELTDICAEWDHYQDLEAQIEGAEHL
ncbi:MAG: PCRF domain-containing protein, partial [Candidatus Syntrophosphaera sp.]